MSLYCFRINALVWPFKLRRRFATLILNVVRPSRPERPFEKRVWLRLPLARVLGMWLKISNSQDCPELYITGKGWKRPFQWYKDHPNRTTIKKVMLFKVNTCRAQFCSLNYRKNNGISVTIIKDDSVHSGTTFLLFVQFKKKRYHWKACEKNCKIQMTDFI